MKLSHLLISFTLFVSLTLSFDRVLYEEDDDSYYDRPSTNNGAKQEKKFPPVCHHYYILIGSCGSLSEDAEGRQFYFAKPAALRRHCERKRPLHGHTWIQELHCVENSSSFAQRQLHH